ncbi:uncharacterized protein LOC105203290 [Solenopsis invicta]|uniref:uncharacterized protein LOC105203290 n=1 Tax=Solenopsis invicta TaxID=13686 RepID=UPI00193DE3CA|nr:uncharacterized protein LOC105203290 [Solenopsis invicta]
MTEPQPNARTGSTQFSSKRCPLRHQTSTLPSERKRQNRDSSADEYQSNTQASTPRSTRAESESAAHVRLPKLNLLTFSGKYEEWFPFRDTFTSLTDKALDIIKTLEISDSNYDLAWNILKDRYDNKRLIVQTHIKTIFELPAVVKENAGDIRQLADGMLTHIPALNALNCDADKWDALLIHIIMSKLDNITSREWHASLQGTELSTFVELTDFLARHSQVLEESARRDNSVSDRSHSCSQARSGFGRCALHAIVERGKCAYCEDAHLIYYCKNFLALLISRRIGEMRGRKTCLNCLRSRDHVAAECPSSGCRTCKQKHNTLLHLSKEGRKISDPQADGSASDGSSSAAADSASVVAHGAIGGGSADAFFPTALVYIYGANGSRVTCRALLDSRAQANFITRKCLKTLKLNTRLVNISISGMGGAMFVSNRVARIRLRSRLSSFESEFDCFVAEKITDRIPTSTLRRQAFRLPSGIDLTDPKFYVSNIDLLIGTDLFWRLLCVGQIQATSEHPIIQKTRVGGNGYTREEQACVDHFMRNVSNSGKDRYIVELPLRRDIVQRLGESRKTAMKRFLGLEKRLNRDSVLKRAYVDFLREYLLLGHIRIAPASPTGSRPIYLLHHEVIKGNG